MIRRKSRTERVITAVLMSFGKPLNEPGDQGSLPTPTTPGSLNVRLFKARYTRLHDRILAVIWPPKRRQLRMMQALVDSSEQAVQHEAARILRDLALSDVGTRIPRLRFWQGFVCGLALGLLVLEIVVAAAWPR